jgi:hypothetical protein
MHAMHLQHCRCSMDTWHALLLLLLLLLLRPNTTLCPAGVQGDAMLATDIIIQWARPGQVQGVHVARPWTPLTWISCMIIGTTSFGMGRSMIFTATSSSVFTSRASHVSPVPPLPSTLMTSYKPAQERQYT